MRPWQRSQRGRPGQWTGPAELRRPGAAVSVRGSRGTLRLTSESLPNLPFLALNCLPKEAPPHAWLSAALVMSCAVWGFLTFSSLLGRTPPLPSALRPICASHPRADCGAVALPDGVAALHPVVLAAIPAAFFRDGARRAPHTCPPAPTPRSPLPRPRLPSSLIACPDDTLLDAHTSAQRIQKLRSGLAPGNGACLGSVA